MSEQQEIVHVVMRQSRPGRTTSAPKPVKVFDDRSDAREYAKRFNQATSRYKYSVVSVKKG